MKKITLVYIILLFCFSTKARNSEYFSYNKTKIYSECVELTKIENEILSNNYKIDKALYKEYKIDNSIINLNNKSNLAPGKIPSFWFAFVIGAVGTYTIYGAGLGPTAVAIVAIATKDKEEIKKASIGCLIGSLIGGGAKLLIMNTKAALR